MKQNNEMNREERALVALIVGAFLNNADANEEKINKRKLEASLTEEDRKALDALGANLVEKVISGEWEANRPIREECEAAAEAESLDLLVAMHRGDADTGLSPEARREIEEKIREAEQELDSESDEEES